MIGQAGVGIDRTQRRRRKKRKVEQIVNLPCQIYTRNMSIPGSRLNRNPETRTKPTQIGFGLPSQPHAADLLMEGDEVEIRDFFPSRDVKERT